MDQDQGEARIESLRNAGFQIKSPLPDAYRDVIEGLGDEELRTLIEVKQALDKAELGTAADVSPWRSYFVPF